MWYTECGRQRERNLKWTQWQDGLRQGDDITKDDLVFCRNTHTEVFRVNKVSEKEVNLSGSLNGSQVGGWVPLSHVWLVRTTAWARQIQNREWVKREDRNLEDGKMGAVKSFAEEVSESMGLGGEINDKVIEEACARFEELLTEARDKGRVRVYIEDAAEEIMESLGELDSEALLIEVKDLFDLNGYLEEAISDLDYKAFADLYEKLVPGVKNARFQSDSGDDFLTYQKV